MILLECTRTSICTYTCTCTCLGLCGCVTSAGSDSLLLSPSSLVWQ